jgi:chromosome segregation ATPase
MKPSLYSEEIFTSVDLVQIIKRVESNALILIPIYKARIADLEKELEETRSDPSNYLESYKQNLRDRIKQQEEVPELYRDTSNIQHLKKQLTDTEEEKGEALAICNFRMNNLRHLITKLNRFIKELESPIATGLSEVLSGCDFRSIKKYVT